MSEAARLFITNAYSPIYVAEMVFDRLKPQRHARDHVVAHGQRGARNHLRGWRMGNLSCKQVGLNMLARCFYQRHQDEGRTLLIMHPGWVKTDMGGDDAPVDLTTSAEGLYNTLEKWSGSGEEAYVDYRRQCAALVARQ